MKLPESIQIDNPRAREAFREGYRRQMQGELEEAERLYRRSLEHERTAEGHTFLGWVLSEQGDFEGAIRECRTAIDLDPEFGNPYNDIGVYHLEQGRAERAKPWFRMALDAPRYESYCFPHFNLGRVHWMRGHFEEARRHFHKALEERPGFTNAERALRRLKHRLN